jgi:hypothetical protein
MKFDDHSLFREAGDLHASAAAGFRFGTKGTHTSRTIMLLELRALFQATGPNAGRADYAAAVVKENCLAKKTIATRRLSAQRLSELYGLDSSIPVFRVLRKLWNLNEESRPLLAIQCSIARDPLLAATAYPILSIPIGDDFPRESVRAALLKSVGERLNDSTLNKVVRNAASSWTQSGHLQGRTLKKRLQVYPTPVNVAYSLFLARCGGFRGTELFTCGWMLLLDCSPSMARELAFEAKRLGLIDLRMAADVIELNLDRLSSGVQGL